MAASMLKTIVLTNALETPFPLLVNVALLSIVVVTVLTLHLPLVAGRVDIIWVVKTYFVRLV